MIPLVFNETNTIVSIIYLFSDSSSHCHRRSRYVIIFVWFLYILTKPLFNLLYFSVGFHVTATEVSPMDEIIDLGPVPVAESRGHSTTYYLNVWIEYLSSKNIGYQINYSSSSHIAVVLLDGVRVFKIPCQSRRVVKGYYIAFRMCGDDFELLKRYLSSYSKETRNNVTPILYGKCRPAKTSLFQKALLSKILTCRPDSTTVDNESYGLSDESTPEQNEEFEMGVDWDLVRRRRNCCTISDTPSTALTSLARDQRISPSIRSGLACYFVN
jgi:hypothetical protein